MPSVAIVILCYNNRLFLEKFLPGVLAYSHDAETIVVDNASTDDTMAFMMAHYPEVRTIRHDINYGFCGGYNHALAQIETDFYVLLNSDVEVTEGWLQPMVDLMLQNPIIGACQPKILSYSEKNKFEYAGAGGGFIDRLGYPFCRGRIFQHLETDTGQYNDTVPVFWATGACMVVRASLYHKLGGLEKSFFAHMEEIDLCWRMQRAAYKVYYCGQSTVYHVGGGTLQQDSPRKTFLNFRNNLSLLLRNLPLAALFWIFPLRVLLDWAAALSFLLQRKPKNAWAVLRAQAAVFLVMGKLRDWRRQGKVAGPPSADLTGVYKGSIVWQYFIKKKTTFGQLNIPNGAFFATEMPADIYQKSKA